MGPELSKVVRIYNLHLKSHDVSAIWKGIKKMVKGLTIATMVTNYLRTSPAMILQGALLAALLAILLSTLGLALFATDLSRQSTWNNSEQKRFYKPPLKQRGVVSEVG